MTSQSVGVCFNFSSKNDDVVGKVRVWVWDGACGGQTQDGVRGGGGVGF